MSVVRAFNGTRILLSEERWKHITLRHPELEDKMAKVLAAVANPDEVYVDPIEAVHVLKRLTHEISDHLVVIYRKEDGECYIRTAYYTSSRRKERRYKRFKRLKPS
ncbi:MAG: hypothetical protein AOA66_0469 [Candidatus Bathyarchaeota archaeon BA2]|nr:MAG: hypothetical protein AOA66_0469 [Candidatus Bathyarchaeota archaeon BA2]